FLVLARYRGGVFCAHVCLRGAGAGPRYALGGGATQCGRGGAGVGLLALSAAAQLAGGFRAARGAAFYWAQCPGYPS
nr:hypothetical protein [Tanacetum cinerariifolium]